MNPAEAIAEPKAVDDLDQFGPCPHTVDGHAGCLDATLAPLCSGECMKGREAL